MNCRVVVVVVLPEVFVGAGVGASVADVFVVGDLVVVASHCAWRELT